MNALPPLGGKKNKLRHLAWESAPSTEPHAMDVVRAIATAEPRLQRASEAANDADWLHTSKLQFGP
jgi:hypothetical protein